MTRKSNQPKLLNPNHKSGWIDILKNWKLELIRGLTHYGWVSLTNLKIMLQPNPKLTIMKIKNI